MALAQPFELSSCACKHFFCKLQNTCCICTVLKSCMCYACATYDPTYLTTHIHHIMYMYMYMRVYINAYTTQTVCIRMQCSNKCLKICLQLKNKKDRHDQQEISYPRMALSKKFHYFCGEWSVFSCAVTLLLCANNKKIKKQTLTNSRETTWAIS